MIRSVSPASRNVLKWWVAVDLLMPSYSAEHCRAVAGVAQATHHFQPDRILECDQHLVHRPDRVTHHISGLDDLRLAHAVPFVTR